MRVWPSMEITARVRLRGIDPPELHARCDDERLKVLAAREALARLLAEGSVGISRVGQESATMLTGGFARRYSGGRRESWCG